MANLFASLLRRPVVRRRNARLLAGALPPDGIREARYVTVGGIPQWVTIRGEDRGNPILFFLHGGPGMGHTMFNPLIAPWERHFTLVQWDQRGSGRTRRRAGALRPGELTLERLEADAAELAEWLLAHLGHDRLVLLGSSAGSTFGLALAQHRPDLLHAYVGTDQNTGLATARLSWQATLEGLRRTGDTRAVEAVEAIGPDPASWTARQTDLLARRSVGANPAVPNMISDLILPALLGSPEHTVRDLRDTFKGMAESRDQWHDQIARFDARALGSRFDVPVVVVQGGGDTVTPAPAAADYLETISAPYRELVLIRDAGHLAMFARPDRFLDTLQHRVRPLVTTAAPTRAVGSDG